MPSPCNRVSVVHSYGLLHMITTDIREVYPQATKRKLYTFKCCMYNQYLCTIPWIEYLKWISERFANWVTSKPLLIASNLSYHHPGLCIAHAKLHASMPLDNWVTSKHRTVQVEAWYSHHFWSFENWQTVNFTTLFTISKFKSAPGSQTVCREQYSIVNIQW